MARKQARVSRRMLFIWCTLGGFILLLSPESLTSRCQLAFVRVFGWPLSTGRAISMAANAPAVTDTVPRLEYDKLAAAYRRQENVLANVSAQLEMEHHKVETLSRLSSVPELQRMSFRLADVITAADAGQDELLINCGQRDGVAVGQYVLSTTDVCVIGRVSAVSSATAKVRLMTHPAARTQVKISGLNQRGLMTGRGNGTAKIPLIRMERPLKVGDLLYADKTAGFLDVPIVAGRIAQCRRSGDDPLLWDVTVEPLCKTAELAEVAVVVANP